MNSMNEQKKSALVLGGGGSRGSYSSGVIATLSEQKKQYQIVTGISIGSFVGAIFAMNTPVNLPQWIASMNAGRVASNLFEFPDRLQAAAPAGLSFNEFIAAYQKSGPDFEPMRKSFLEIFDFEKFKNSPIDYACIAANLTKNEETVFHKADMKTADQAIDCMLASSSYFPAFSFTKIGNDYYADGGFVHATLGKAAIEMGAQDLTIVALDDPDVPLKYVEEKTSLLIRPIVRLAYFLEFDSRTLADQTEQGRLEALKYMNLAPGYIYTFYPEDTFILESLSRLARDILEKHHIQFDQSMLIKGISTLLGYEPAPLDNDYMKNAAVGLILEILGLVSGISYYRRHHLLDFIREILAALKANDVSFTKTDLASTLKMDVIGARDLMNFLHAALEQYDGQLPASFDLIKSKFESVYYLALAWYFLDKFSIVLKLI